MASNYVKNYQRQRQQRETNKKAEIDAIKKQRAEYLINSPIQSSVDVNLAASRAKMANFDKQISDIENRKLSAKEKGIDTALDVLGPSGLERIGDDRDVQAALAMKKAGIGKQEAMTKKQAGLTSRYEKIADEGIGTAEREQMRARMAQQMGQAQQMVGFQLGGALGGAKGAGVAAQQRSLAAQGLAARAGIESNIFLAQEAAKRQGLQGMAVALASEQASVAAERAATDAYTSSLGDVKTFDIGQAAKERDIMFQSIMGYEQMESAEKAAKMQADAAAKRGSGGCHITGTKILMADKSYKNIEDLKIGDEVMLGGKVLGCGSLLSQELFYTYNGEIFTQSHLVFNPKTKIYERADESEVCSLVVQKDLVVHPIFTENRCYVTSFVSGDFGMEEEYREKRKDLTYKMKGLGYVGV